MPVSFTQKSLKSSRRNAYEQKKAQVGLRARTVDHLNAWLIMLPSLVLMLFFVWEPLFESVVMSLYKTRNIELMNFIGFKITSASWAKMTSCRR